MEQPLPTAGGKAGEDGKQNKTGRKHGTQKFIAGWSSPVARQAHNLKAAGSNPAPATKSTKPRGIHHGVLAFMNEILHGKRLRVLHHTQLSELSDPSNMVNVIETWSASRNL